MAQSRGLTNFLHYNPFKFKGNVSPAKSDLWLWEMERIFEVIKCPVGTKLNYATYRFLGDTKYWWRNTKLMMDDALVEVKWEPFKRKILDKYF